MTALYHLEHRFQVAPETIAGVRAACLASNNYSWVGDRRLRIHTWLGVPGRHCDILLDDATSRVGTPHQITLDRGATAVMRPWMLVCDIGRKAGRYDGAVRWRVTFRDLQPSNSAAEPPHGRFVVEEHQLGSVAELAVIAIWSGGCWAQSFPQLRYTVDERTDRQGILLDQAKAWFKFLWVSAEDDIRALAAEWASRPWVVSERHINALNRSASEALYQIACNLGWTKLALHQRRRLGLADNSACWQRSDYVQSLRVQAGLANPSGVGQYTLDAASGVSLVLPRGICPQCNELEEDCECVQ